MVAADELERARLALRTAQAQNAMLRQLVAMHDRLGALVLQGADLAAVIAALADVIGRQVLLLDSELQASQAGSPAGANGVAVWRPAAGYVSGVLATLVGERRPLRVPPMPDWGVEAVCVLAPVAVGDAILGYLAILEPAESNPSDDVELQVVQHAATVCALAMMRERMATEVAQELRDELFEGLLQGRGQDEQVARERAVRLGYEPHTAYRVLVVAADSPAPSDRAELGPRRRHLFENLADVCRRRAAGALTLVRSDELVVLAPEPAAAADVGRIAVQQSRALAPSWQVTVGIGETCRAAADISRSHEQARRAVDTARRFGRQGDVVSFEELGVYRLLFHVQDPAELRGFVDQVLGPLLAYDARHQTHLVLTLTTYLARNGNLQATARELSLHVNSVAYRLQRIQAIAGIDLEQAEDRLLAQVALKIHGGTGS